MRARVVFLPAVSLVVVGLLGCKKEKDDPPPPPSVSLPALGAINLSTLGVDPDTASLRLQGDEDCTAAENLGWASWALGPACSLGGLHGELLMGPRGGDFDGDGAVTCADLTAAESQARSAGLEDSEAGLLLHMMCEDVFRVTPNVTSLAMQETASEAFAISFLDWNSADAFRAQGKWTAGNAGSYPAAIRVWTGGRLADMAGVAAMALDSANKGTLYLDIPMDGSGLPLQFLVGFGNAADQAACERSPGVSTCHWSDVRLAAGEALGAQAPSGMHIKVLANDKDEPTLLAIQYEYSFSEAAATALFGGEGSPFAADSLPRRIVGKVVQTRDEIWGQYRYLDADGALVTLPDAGADALFAAMADDAGTCQAFGSDQPAAECSAPATAATVATLKQSFFVDFESFGGVEEGASLVPAAIFAEDVPDTAGITTAP